MKITLNDVTNIDSLSVINSNFDKIATALQDEVLYRDNPVGEPNVLQNNIDLNGFDILNVGRINTSEGSLVSTTALDAAVLSATTSASTASTASFNATTAKNFAEAANTAAQSAKISVESLYDQFDDRYLGAKASDPTLDNDGDALISGAMYFKTSGTPVLRVWNGTAWQDSASVTANIVNTIDAGLYASQAEAEAGADNTKVLTSLRVKQAIDSKNLMPKSGGSFTAGVQTKSTAIASLDIDLALGNVFSKTISGASTLTLSNVPSSGTVASFILELTNPSTNVTFWSNVRWPSGVAPVFTTTGKDILGFYTTDGGSNWNGFVLGYDVK